MIYTLFGILIAVCFTIALLIVGDEHDSVFASLFGIVLGVASGIAIIAFIFLAWDYKASSYKSAIINREYGTNYTREEVFYAHDVIDTIRELDRKRYQINGDIMKGAK